MREPALGPLKPIVLLLLLLLLLLMPAAAPLNIPSMTNPREERRLRQGDWGW